MTLVAVVFIVPVVLHLLLLVLVVKQSYSWTPKATIREGKFPTNTIYEVLNCSNNQLWCNMHTLSFFFFFHQQEWTQEQTTTMRLTEQLQQDAPLHNSQFDATQIARPKSLPVYRLMRSCWDKDFLKVSGCSHACTTATIPLLVSVKDRLSSAKHKCPCWTNHRQY